MIVDLGLARRIEDADAALGSARVRRIAEAEPSLGARVERAGHGVVLLAGAGSPLNGAHSLGLHGPVTADELGRVAAAFASSRLPSSVLACPLADATLFRGLAAGHAVTGVVDALVRDPAGEVPLTPSDVTIEVAHGPAGQEWVETATRGFLGERGGAEGALTESEMRRLATSLRGLPGVTCLLARVDGEPAGAAAAAFHEGVATLTSAATREPFRRRGVHGALVAARLRLAQEHRCDLAVVWSRPGTRTHRALQRGGFSLAYGRLRLDAVR